MLDNPVEPINETTFFHCLDTATNKSQQLTKSMTDVATSLKKEDRDSFRGAIGDASDAVCALTESAAQVNSIAIRNATLLSFLIFTSILFPSLFRSLYICTPMH